MELTVEIRLEVVDDEVVARASLDALGEHFEAAGSSPRSGWLRSELPVVPQGLALARALRGLEALVMETVHEHLDRSAVDDV
ncbi:MAG TPA: hypothetical protein ENK55_01710 [Actinobacteria bacterium]|nr:hypothetical protein [Actinomycetota bacterium]